MKPIASAGLNAILLVGILGCQRSPAQQPITASMQLTNGVRALVIHFPQSTNLSVFTFLPMGLAQDGPEQAQWSHLVEHMVIRSTVPDSSASANAETLPDHMRLDYYGSVADLDEALSHHRRWIEGVPFAEETLKAERPKVKSECDFTAKNLATHKFAIAAWNQAYRHRRKHAALKGDVDRASLDAIQRYRNDRLAVLDRCLVCIVGGIETNDGLSALEKSFAPLISAAKAAPEIEIDGGDKSVTWDLEARHLLLTWPIPEFSHEDFAALMTTGQLLTMRLFGDPELKASTGMNLAGADLVTPEGAFFYVSSSVKSEAGFDDVLTRLEKHLEAVRSERGAVSQAPLMARQFATALRTVPDPGPFKSQAPPELSIAMIEGNIGLQFAHNHYRFGDQRLRLASRLEQLPANEVSRAAAKYLSREKRSVCRIEPESE